MELMLSELGKDYIIFSIMYSDTYNTLEIMKIVLN